MRASINPLGERARHTRWGRTATWYIAGSTVGGLVIGAGAGALGAGLHRLAPSPKLLAILAVGVCVLGLGFDLGVLGARLPTVHRQVNENWLARYRGWVYGGGFGFQLGLGVVTVVTTSTVYIALTLAVLAGSLGAGLLVGGVFGLVRALPVLAMSRADNPRRLRDALGRVHDWSGAATIAAIACLILVAATSAALIA